MAFEPLPPPGLAIFPQFLSAQPQTILMRGEVFGDDLEISYADGRTFLGVDAAKFSLSHRKQLIDANTGDKICEIRKKKLRSKYYGVSENGTILFESESQFKLAGSSTTLKFTNNAAGNGQQELLEFNSERFSHHGEFTYQGKPVASLTKKKMSMSGRYELQIAPGLDPFLIVVFAVAVLDREQSKTRTRRNVIIGANAGGGAGA